MQKSLQVKLDSETRLEIGSSGSNTDSDRKAKRQAEKQTWPYKNSVRGEVELVTAASHTADCSYL